MGTHACPRPREGFIHSNAESYFSQASGGDTTIAFASGNRWRVPDALAYYIVDCGWQPPADFIRDVMHSSVTSLRRRQTRGKSGDGSIAIGYLQQPDVDIAREMGWDTSLASFDAFTHRLFKLVPSLAADNLSGKPLNAIITNVQSHLHQVEGGPREIRVEHFDRDIHPSVTIYFPTMETARRAAAAIDFSIGAAADQGKSSPYVGFPIKENHSLADYERALRQAGVKNEAVLAKARGEIDGVLKRLQAITEAINEGRDTKWGKAVEAGRLQMEAAGFETGSEDGRFLEYDLATQMRFSRQYGGKVVVEGIERLPAFRAYNERMEKTQGYSFLQKPENVREVTTTLRRIFSRMEIRVEFGQARSSSDYPPMTVHPDDVAKLEELGAEIGGLSVRQAAGGSDYGLDTILAPPPSSRAPTAGITTAEPITDIVAPIAAAYAQVIAHSRTTTFTRRVNNSQNKATAVLLPVMQRLDAAVKSGAPITDVLTELSHAVTNDVAPIRRANKVIEIFPEERKWFDRLERAAEAARIVLAEDKGGELTAEKWEAALASSRERV